MEFPQTESELSCAPAELSALHYSCDPAQWISVHPVLNGFGLSVFPLKYTKESVGTILRLVF